MRSSLKSLIIINLIGSTIFLALVCGVPETTIRFILLGELPGGNALLSPDTMLLIIFLCFFAVLLLLVPASAYRKVVKMLSFSKFHLPKSRYTSL